MDSEDWDARAIEALTASAPLSDCCLVGPFIMTLNCQARWSAWRPRDDRIYSAARRVLIRTDVPRFSSEEEWIKWLTKTIPVAGGFLLDRESYRFTESICNWKPGAGLAVSATGQHCKLQFDGIPFPGAERIADVEGHDWPPSPHGEIRRPKKLPGRCEVEAGGFAIRDLDLEIDCGAYHTDPESLNVSFQGFARTPGQRKDKHISGSLYCRVATLVD
jgi:hypothetical protein